MQPSPRAEPQATLASLRFCIRAPLSFTPYFPLHGIRGWTRFHTSRSVGGRSRRPISSARARRARARVAGGQPAAERLIQPRPTTKRLPALLRGLELVAEQCALARRALARVDQPCSYWSCVSEGFLRPNRRRAGTPRPPDQLECREPVSTFGERPGGWRRVAGPRLVVRARACSTLARSTPASKIGAAGPPAIEKLRFRPAERPVRLGAGRPALPVRQVG